jgi:hypothetical protein
MVSPAAGRHHIQVRWAIDLRFLKPGCGLFDAALARRFDQC